MKRMENYQAKDTKVHEGCGYLPSCAPLANPFVPFQRNDPARYEAPEWLVRGTLFPGLDLPFLGMVNENALPATPMHELQALGFAINELILYLDTHSDDQEAAQLLQSYSELYRKGLEIVRQQSGPMRGIDAVMDGKFRWLDGGWPWEYRDHKED